MGTAEQMNKEPQNVEGKPQGGVFYGELNKHKEEPFSIKKDSVY